MNSPFPWPGGKRALKKTLLQLIPEHAIYVEAFAGSAKLLFAKDPSRMEVLNDLNGDVTNFFRIAKHRPAELAEALELETVHAGRFRDLRTEQPRDCELQRALRFAYLAWYSFGGKGEHFASPSAKSPDTKRPLCRVRDLLQATAARLSRVVIEQRDFENILQRFDTAETFFYLDPPYVRFQPNGRYEPLGEERRAAMFQQLAKLKGKFLLSFDDHPEIRSLSSHHDFVIKPVRVAYTLAGINRPAEKSRELLIANYSLTSA